MANDYHENDTWGKFFILICLIVVTSLIALMVFKVESNKSNVQSKIELSHISPNSTDLEKFFQKTMSEIESSQSEIQKIVEVHGEGEGYEVIKEIIFKNFSQIPGVVSDTVITTVVMETKRVD